MGELGGMLAAARAAKEEQAPGEWRQRDLAERLKDKPPAQAISNYERGTNVPEADRMRELIRLLELDPPAAWDAWIRAQLTDEETAAASAPASEDDWLAPMWERRQTPRPAADDAPPAEQGTAEGSER